MVVSFTIIILYGPNIPQRRVDLGKSWIKIIITITIDIVYQGRRFQYVVMIYGILFQMIQY